MRGKNLIKLLKALEILSNPEGTTIEQMASRLEVNRRSVYRLLEVIEGLGFPIYDENIPLEREKRWKLEETYLKKLPNMRVPDINLSLSEIISLYLLRSEASLLKGTDLEKHTHSAFGKFSMFLPGDALEKLDRIKALFVSASRFMKDYSGKEKLVEQLMDAIMKKETCDIGYHSFHDDKLKNFRIDPLHFFENNGGLYILVNTSTYGDIRTLAVERIQNIKRTGESFQYPEGFDPEALLESAFDMVYGDPVKVRIWFSPDQVRYVKERKWSKNQEIVDQEDGSIILSMETSGWWDVKRWVLSYGSTAKVLEPEDLRGEILAELRAAQDCYT
mgnify:CR=1 FL=1